MGSIVRMLFSICCARTWAISAHRACSQNSQVLNHSPQNFCFIRAIFPSGGEKWRDKQNQRDNSPEAEEQYGDLPLDRAQSRGPNRCSSRYRTENSENGPSHLRRHYTSRRAGAGGEGNKNIPCRGRPCQSTRAKGENALRPAPTTASTRS